MESTCFLAFIREYMLLATVLDSFCISNTFSWFGKDMVYGRFTGFHSFLTQDLPQLSIHLCFKLIILNEIQYELKSTTLLMVGVTVSVFANGISIFNMIMCDLNEFNPTKMEEEIERRRVKYQKENEEEA